MSQPTMLERDSCDLSEAWLQDLPRRYTPSGTAYFECGSGDTVIFVHGVGMRAEVWAPQLRHLESRYRVIALDLPGHGLSAKLPVGSRLENFVAWFDRFMVEIGVEQANICGHSMGALIAAGAAATMGARVRRIAFMNGVHCRDAAAKAAVRTRAERISTQGVNCLGPLDRWFQDEENSDVARVFARRWLTMVDPAGYAVAYNAFANGDETYADKWKGVNCPALFLAGAEDRNSTVEMARQLADIAPQGYLRVIDGHGHMATMTAPDRVNARIDEWLQLDLGKA